MAAKRNPKRKPAIDELVEVMARLRGPDGCPWDREQDHKSIRFHAVEEVYELIDAIEAEDDHEMLENAETYCSGGLPLPTCEGTESV